MKLHWIRERCRAGWALGVIAAVGVGVCGAGCGDETTSPPTTDTTGGDASTPVPPGPTGPTCTAPKTVCGEGCVDLQTDFGNCGGCGKSCVAGQVCAGGACALACAGGATKCGEACVDTQVDPNNCGACGNKCDPGLVCSAGQCGLTCTGDLTKCGGGDAGGSQAFCANIKEDSDNCGACGTKCTGSSRCLDGACVDNCSTGADCSASAASCAAGKCVVPVDCSAIKHENPAAPSGAYTIDPDGAGGGAAFTAYCDMVTDGGGWTIVAAMSGADGEEGLTSDTEASGDPLAFTHYNLNRAKKAALGVISQESIFVRQDGRWIKADKPMFDADLVVADKDKAFPVKLNAMNGAITDQATTYGFMAWSNHAIDGGGDFALSSLKDGTTTCNANVTTNGVDHHSPDYLQLNCNCKGDYLYSYSNVTLDGDASYGAETTLGGWTSTGVCASIEGDGIVFYAAMRRPLADYMSCSAMHAALPSAPSGWYLIDPDGAAGNPPLGAYCDMVTDGGGYTEVPVTGGISTKNKDEANSCQAIGLEIGVPRTHQHQRAMWTQFGAASGYFATVPGVYGVAAGNYTGCAMNSDDATCSANWKAIDGKAWFARSLPTNQGPSGDYTPGCWLQAHDPDGLGWQFNDATCTYFTGDRYICSDNAK